MPSGIVRAQLSIGLLPWLEEELFAPQGLINMGVVQLAGVQPVRRMRKKQCSRKKSVIVVTQEWLLFLSHGSKLRGKASALEHIPQGLSKRFLATTRLSRKTL